MGIHISGNPANYNIENDNPQNDNILISTKTNQKPETGIPVSANSKFIKANRDRFILPLDKDITLFTNIIDDCVRYVIS
jgi:hypothetical protein